jgi:hypothetical protein
LSILENGDAREWSSGKRVNPNQPGIPTHPAKPPREPNPESEAIIEAVSSELAAEQGAVQEQIGHKTVGEHMAEVDPTSPAMMAEVSKRYQQVSPFVAPGPADRYRALLAQREADARAAAEPTVSIYDYGYEDEEPTVEEHEQMLEEIGYEPDALTQAEADLEAANEAAYLQEQTELKAQAGDE